MTIGTIEEIGKAIGTSPASQALENNTAQHSKDDQAQAINPSYAITSVSVDSREIISGAGCMFFALVSPSGNGHLYIPQAYERGVRCFIISEDYETWQARYADAYFLPVANTLHSLQKLASWHRQRCHNTYIFALIGSNGKTTVKEMLATLLGSEGLALHRSPGSYNSQVGVALSLLAMPGTARYAFIEAGISLPGEMQSLAQMICPQEVIMTHFGSAHSAGFDNLEALYAEKLSILHHSSATRLHYYASPQQEAYIKPILERCVPQGIKLCNAYYPFAQLGHRTGAEDYLSQAEQYLEQLRAEDKTLAQNLCLALSTIATTLAQHLQGACKHIKDISPLPMRMELSENALGKLLINDSYSNDLESLRGAMLSLKQRGGDTMVLGAIEQSALSPKEQQAELVKLCQELNIKQVYLIGWSTALSWEHLGSKTKFTPLSDSEALLNGYQAELLAQPVLLIKGPRRMHLEQLVQNLSRREHDTKLSIDLTALGQNLAYYRSLLPRPAALICMIKADAYGLGAIPIARKLVSSGHVQYLAVAVADEGKALRQAGIDSPIIVMNPQGDSLDSLRRHNLQAEVYSLEMLQRFAEAHTPEHSIPLHLKVDSGMHRLGFARTELKDIVDLLIRYQLPLSSVFSHLAGADEERLDAFTHHQASELYAFYQELCQALERSQGYQHSLPSLHLLNTAGLERFHGRYAYDGARLGIGLYGFSPSGRSEVQPVAKLSTRILQVKSVPRGEGVGYGCRQSSDRERRIAVIPIGYADGLSRRYGNGAWAVDLGGVLCPTVGNICMDASMIDVSAVKGAKAGDEVIIFGSEHTPIEAMAAAGGTIPYEVLTSISPRVTRLYY